MLFCRPNHPVEVRLKYPAQVSMQTRACTHYEFCAADDIQSNSLGSAVDVSATYLVATMPVTKEELLRAGACLFPFLGGVRAPTSDAILLKNNSGS